LLQIVNEMSDGILKPVRRLVPPMGGLDFTPIIGLILLNIIHGLLIQIISLMA
jgi:YggT family protein